MVVPRGASGLPFLKQSSKQENMKMNREPANPFFMRNMLLAAGAVSVLIGLSLKPQILLFFLSRGDLIRVSIIAVSALFSAIQLNTAFERFAEGPDAPWYASPNGCAAVIMGTFGFMTAAFVLDCFARYVAGLSGLFPHKAYVYLFVGLTILCTIRLNWLSKRP